MMVQYIFSIILFIPQHYDFIVKSNKYFSSPFTNYHINSAPMEMVHMDSIESSNIPNTEVACLSNSDQLIRIATETDILDDLSI